MNETLVIGPKFFREERRMYADWKSALLREQIQNSSDRETCTRIDFQIDSEETFDRISIRDNGGGMSRDVLENVFMVLGETTKGEKDTGGFGRARNLICFGANSYIIRSQDYIVRGVGANRETQQTNEFFKGCEFVIEIEKADWIGKLKAILSVSSLKARVFINGEEFEKIPHRARFVRDLSFGKVYVNKSGTPMLVVRSNGLFMFAKNVGVKAMIFVEVEDAKKVLTSNRDGLQYEQQNELDDFLRELASETMSALKPKRQLFRKLLKSGIGFAAKAKKKLIKIGTGIVERREEGAGQMVSAYTNPSAERIADGEYQITEFNRGDLERAGMEVARRNPLLESCYVVCESPDLEVQARKFDPETMDENSTRYKLLATWHKMVEIIAEMHVATVGEFVYGVGFIFSDDGTEAQHRYENGVHYFLVNPINIQTKKIKFSVNNKEDLGELISLAAHEVTHKDCPAHNETFSSRYTNLMKKVLGDYSNILRQVKNVK